MPLDLTTEERTILEHWTRQALRPYGQVRRAQALLLIASGASISTAARTVGMTRYHVYKWKKRFQQIGIQGLFDKGHKARKGRRKWERVKGEKIYK